MPECRHCETYWETEEGAENCCDEYAPEEYSGGEETYDNAVSVPRISMPSLSVPALPNREARLLSIEQETVGRSGFNALREMYAAGIAVAPEYGYDHDDVISDAPGGRKIYATDDPTCGAELTYSRLRPDTQADAIVLGTGMEIARQHVSLSYSCGFHIHVCASPAETRRWLSQNAVLELRATFSGMEDLLYRIASARWQRHRTENGSDYAMAGPYVNDTPGKYSKLQVISGGRYYGLNVSPYIQARSGCNCEAGRWGFWNECSCELTGLQTIEFRLWNATANPVKVRAYAALSLALVSYAESVANGDAAPCTDEVPFRGTQRVNAESLRRQIERLSCLPLDSDDRAAVAYCLTHSSANAAGKSAIETFEAGRDF